MATRGIVIKVGGARPWVSRYGNGSSPSTGEPFETLRAAQLPIEAAANRPVRWRRIDDAEGRLVPPETWVAEDLGSPPVAVGGAGPFTLVDGATFGVSVNGAAPGFAVFNGGIAVATATVLGDYTIAAGTLGVTVTNPSGSALIGVTVAVPPGVAQSAAVASAWLNANAAFSAAGVIQFGFSAVANLLTVQTVVGKGSGWSVSFAGGGSLANSLGFPGSSILGVGTGNVPNLGLVTAQQAVNVLNSQLVGVNSYVNNTAKAALAGLVNGSSQTLSVSNLSTNALGFAPGVVYVGT